METNLCVFFEIFILTYEVVYVFLSRAVHDKTILVD